MGTWDECEVVRPQLVLMGFGKAPQILSPARIFFLLLQIDMPEVGWGGTSANVVGRLEPYEVPPLDSTLSGSN